MTLVLGSAAVWTGPAAHAADVAMISVTLDDGWASQFNNALPVLNKYGIPATMYIHTEAINATPEYMTQAQIQAFASRGDEIASHTVSHADLTLATPAALETELAQSQATLRQMFGPTAAVDFASPFGASNAATTAAVKKYYATQRNTNEGYNSQSGLDPYDILVQNVVDTTTAATVQGWINEAKSTNRWLVLVYHEVGADIGQDVYHIDTAVFDAHMAAVKNSGLPMVTIRQGITGVTPPTTPPPTTPPTTPPPTTPPTTPPPTTPPTTPAAATTAINAAAAANRILGAATSDIACGLINGGCYQMYQNGAINWSPATGAHASFGAIRQGWAATGFEAGRLGYPTSDEVGGLVNGGVYQMYQFGAFNWSPATGARYTLGAIRQGWAATGFEGGRLGYPTSNEVGGLVNGGVYQLFERGAFNWSPATGAHYTLGAIRQAWAATGFENGRLGYPLTNEFASGNGVAQDYQGGRISWTAGGGAAVTYR